MGQRIAPQECPEIRFSRSDCDVFAVRGVDPDKKLETQGLELWVGGALLVFDDQQDAARIARAVSRHVGIATS